MFVFSRAAQIGPIMIQKWHLNPNAERFQRRRPSMRWILIRTGIQRRLDPRPIWGSPHLPLFGLLAARPAPPTTPITQPTPCTFFLSHFYGVFLRFFNVGYTLLNVNTLREHLKLWIEWQSRKMKWDMKGWPMKQHEKLTRGHMRSKIGSRLPNLLSDRLRWINLFRRRGSRLWFIWIQSNLGKNRGFKRRGSKMLGQNRG